ncbi:MAG: DUF3363 domain-containing protein [Proteobacteria bacterium]|nr:DUF3363 domain-containing protein [Pseudomonadota bacterium]
MSPATPVVDAMPNGATWLDQQLVGNAAPPASEFGHAVSAALREREQVLIEQGLARKQGASVLLAGNLLGRLLDRELAAAAAGLEKTTGLSYRPAIDDVRMSRTYRQTVRSLSCMWLPPDLIDAGSPIQSPKRIRQLAARLVEQAATAQQ